MRLLSHAFAAVRVTGLLGGLGAALGCGGTAGSPGTAVVSVGDLGAWEGRIREVFDDNIDPAAVGLSMEGPTPRSDPYLRERAQTAHLVARVRINTVTADSVGDETIYHLSVQVGSPAFTSPKLPEQTVELVIRPTSRAYAIAKAFDTRLRGLTFIGFVHRFANEVGEPELHWHLAPDTAEVAAAVKEAVALGELSGS